MKLHHIGIVVMDSEEAGKRMNSFIPFNQITKAEHVLSQQATVQLFKAGDVYLEFVSPDSMDSKIYNYAKKGGGFHHLCFEVDHVEESFQEMLNKGAKPIIYPVIGFENRMTAFVFLPYADLNCNLLELVEKKNS